MEKPMNKAFKSVINIILNARFSYLFVAIIMLFLVRPFFGSAIAVATTDIFVWFLVISCVWAVHEKRKHQWFAVTMAASVIAADILHFLLQNAATSWISQITVVLFIGYAVFAILFYLVRQNEVTADMVMAGASEYMLIGLLWASLYMLVERAYPGSFSFSAFGDRSEFLYFSFVTLTTTGYGDMVPVSIYARSLAMLEAITGQLFIAIAVARLVSLYTVSGRKDRKDKNHY